MSTVIKVKRSEVASSVPTTSDLAVGEIAVNTQDKKIYVRASGGVVEVANVVAGGASGDITEVLTATGSGLTGGSTAGSANLAINVDDSSLQVSGNTLQVKASGVTNAMLANSGVTINSQSLSLGGSLTLDSDNIGEGSTNLYYSNEKVDDRISVLIQNGTGLSFTYNDSLGTFTPTVSLSSFDTDNLSEGSTNKYYTDAQVQAVSINNVVEDASPQLGGNLDLNSSNITGTGNIDTTGNLTLTSTDTGSSASPELTLERDSASPADADYLGQIKFKGDDDGGSSHVYAKITGKIQDASAGTEDGIIEFANVKAGTNTITARLRSDSLQLLNGTGLTVAGNTTLSGTLNSHTIPSGSGTIALTSDIGSTSFSAVGEHILPSVDDTYDLGSSTKKWRNLYVGGDTIFLDDAKIMKSGGALMMNAGVSNSIASVTISNAGAGYLTQPTLTFPLPDTSGVDTVVISTPGAGYTSAPTVTIDAPAAGGRQATATAVMADDGNGTNTFSVSGVTVDDGGSGYPTAPNVSFSAPGGSGIQTVGSTTVSAATNGGSQASAFASINVNTGEITEVTMVSNGAGYTSVPTLTVSSPNVDTTFNVTVYNDYASGNNYYTLSGGINESLDIIQGQTYTFDLSSSTHSGHLFALSATQDGTHGGGTKLTSGVTYNGTQGTTGATMVLVVDANTPSTLYPYCETHSGMGGTTSLTKLASGTQAVLTPVLATYDDTLNKKIAMEPFALAMSIALGG